MIRSSQASTALGCADTALQTAVACFLARRGPAGDPSGPGGSGRTAVSRSALVGAFVDLLLCDSLALVATRAAQLAPAGSSRYAAAAGYLLPRLLTEASYELSMVLGAEFYRPDGEYAAFQRNVRDLLATGRGPAGAAACRAVLVPQLPRLARESWFADREPPGGLFRLHERVLPPLGLSHLPPAATGDPLAAALLAAAAALDAGRGPADLADLSRTLVAELAGLRRSCAELDGDGRPALSDPRSSALADRYVLVLAGAACLGVWLHQPPGTSGFLADPGWVTTALARLARRLGSPAGKPSADDEELLLAEVLARFRRASSYHLYDLPPVGRPVGAGPETAGNSTAPRHTEPWCDLGSTRAERFPRDVDRDFESVLPVALRDRRTGDLPGPATVPEVPQPFVHPIRVHGPDGPWDAVRAVLLGHGSVLVYGDLSDWLPPDPAAPGLRELLGPDRTRLGRMRHPLARSRFVASRLILKSAAAAVIGVEAQSLELAYRLGGRPVLRGFDQLDISLSHTDSLLLVGLSRRGWIGVDAELRDRQLVAPGIERQICTPHERELIGRLAEKDRDGALIRLWTLKEAYSKAVGLGRRLSFTEFGFGSPDGEIRLLLPDGRPGAGNEWTFHSLLLEQRYMVSAALFDAGFGRIADGVDASCAESGLSVELTDSHGRHRRN